MSAMDRSTSVLASYTAQEAAKRSIQNQSYSSVVMHTATSAMFAVAATKEGIKQRVAALQANKYPVSTTRNLL